MINSLLLRLLTAALAAAGLLLSGAGPARPRPLPVAWLSPAALADSLRTHPRPVLVVLSTNWCRYCRLQEATTFRDPAVVARLRAGFYCVRLDAEGREPLRWAGRRYDFVATGPGTGTHALALALGTEGSAPLSYPTTVLLDSALRVRGRWPGLIRAAELLPALAVLTAN